MHDNPQQAVQYAYIAGIIDGEGHMSIRRNSPGLKCLEGSHYKNYKYMAVVGIGMSNKGIVQMVADHFESSALSVERILGKKTIYRTTVSGRSKVIEGVKKLLPYLIEKQEKARILLDYCENYEIPYNRKLGINAKELARREDLYQKIKKLNSRNAVAQTEYFGLERVSDSRGL